VSAGRDALGQARGQLPGFRPACINTAWLRVNESTPLSVRGFYTQWNLCDSGRSDRLGLRGGVRRPHCVPTKRWYHFLPVSAIVVTSAVNHRRIGRARTWLESRLVAEEVLIIGASLDAANELARKVAEEKGAAFGWHRLKPTDPTSVVKFVCSENRLRQIVETSDPDSANKTFEASPGQSATIHGGSFLALLAPVRRQRSEHLRCCRKTLARMRLLWAPIKH
jgi:hypothetical protein